MRRRRFLAAGALGLSTVAVGCAAVDAPGTSRHPLADSTATVRIDESSETDHDLRANARTAMDYWEANAEQYCGFGIEFEVVEADDPDIAIAYVDSPEVCRAVENFSPNVMGCAPVLRPGRRFDGTATAYVVAGARPYGEIRTTTEHELGHVLGLLHEDEPRHIMSNRPSDRIPLYDVRIAIWEAVIAVTNQTTTATTLIDHGLGQWNQGHYPAAEAAFVEATAAFVAARDRAGAARERTGEFEGHPDAATVDLDGLRWHLDRLCQRLDAAVGFTGRMGAAARASDRGERASAAESLSEANSHIAAFNDVDVMRLRDVAEALGLVRGYDRVDPVVDVDVEAGDV